MRKKLDSNKTISWQYNLQLQEFAAEKKADEAKELKLLSSIWFRAYFDWKVLPPRGDVALKEREGERSWSTQIKPTI